MQQKSRSSGHLRKVNPLNILHSADSTQNEQGRLQWVMDITLPFIRLPYAFDVNRLATEAQTFPASAWREHPTGLAGNSALPLVSRGGENNDDFFGEMQPTPQLRESPYLRQVLASFDEVIGRARLMKLEPGCEVATHVDFNYHWHSRVRIHIPVLTDSQVRFTCADRTIHMKGGECWIFNSWRRHRVVNGWDQPRIHLVLDIAGSSRFWSMVDSASQVDPECAPEQYQNGLHYVPFVPEERATVATERFNMLPVMAPGELEALVNELIGEFEHHPPNNPKLVESYRALLQNLSRDWRVAWSVHGFGPSGRPHYRKLLQSVYQQLHPDRRALVTASNQVGVNPIIVQRILRAALAPEVSDQFESVVAPN